MKHKQKFSLLRIDSEQLRDAENKIELVSCPHGGKICDKHLAAINGSFVESKAYRKDKDYTRSIYSLKAAYVIASDLKEEKCAKCSGLFRSTINQSLEIIHNELHGMSTGLFKTKKYLASYTLAETVMDEFKKEGGRYQTNHVKMNEPLREVV